MSKATCCRTGAYSGGGENLTFNGAYCNAGQGLDVDTGVFTCPIGQETQGSLGPY